jgi:hypothetical protein
MKKILSAFLFLCFFIATAQLKSPADFLPNYGSHVTYYHQLENYYTYLVQNSSFIKQLPYGTTNQGRSLNAYIISTPENLKNSESIRQYHLFKIGLAENAPNIADEIAVVWLSFNVHGNEPAGAESSMQVAFNLVNPDNPEIKKWLEKTIVILDPCLNPDGFSRYGNWLHDVTGKYTHPGSNDREHMEPWPGGRQNHYAFDLNRDWAWQTQAETRQRMVLYNQWMPMVHVDVHEMGYNEPYFFPPAAEPIHDFITAYQKEFHNKIGENTSAKFDLEGWSYYTHERFDLFYPSYGDTYPCFNGAVGMTYEQGGIGAGRAVKMNNGNILTLQDRIDHHTAAVLTAVETASMQREKLVGNFRNYFKDSKENPKGKYKTYIVKNSGKNVQMAQLLDLNKIEYSYADESRKLKGYSYQHGKDKDFTVEPNDLIINAHQPKAVLAQVLFEPVQRLSDSLSYDITAWALPLAYGTESYALTTSPGLKTKKERSYKSRLEYDRAYAYYIPWNGREAVQALSELHKNNIVVRMANKASAFRGIKIAPGDLIVLKSDNTKIADFEITLNIVLDCKPDYEVIESGFSVSGADLGGEFYTILKKPEVLLLSGSGISPTDFGEAWFYMDEVANYPVSIIDIQNLGRINFSEFNTIILPDGWYTFTDPLKNKINNFISNGGKVIAMGGALNLFEDAPGFGLTRFATEGDKSAEQQAESEELLKARFDNYEGAERRAISSSIAGAIIENVVDGTHPLGYGLGNVYYSLKTNDNRYQLLKDAQNVVYVPANYKSYGFIGSSLKKKLGDTVTFAVENKGRGQVVYMADDPLFRGFWENGNLLFANALFLLN